MTIKECEEEIKRIEKIRENKINVYILPIDIRLNQLWDELEKLKTINRDEHLEIRKG